MIPADTRFVALVSVTSDPTTGDVVRLLESVWASKHEAIAAAREAVLADTSATYIVLEISDAFRASKPTAEFANLHWPAQNEPERVP